MSILDRIPVIPPKGSENRKHFIKARREKLLELYPEERHQEIHLGDKWLVKQQNGSTGKWYFCEYTEKSFKKMKAYTCG